jgi:heptosyltransferase-1
MMNEVPRRVLVILMGALGDVVRGLYIVDMIKKASPTTHITWLVEPACAGIVRLHAQVDEVLVFQRPRGIRGVLSLRRELQSRSFDVTLDLQRHFKSGLFSWLSRSPRRIGFHRRDAKEMNWLFNTEHVDPQGESIAKVDHYQTFLERIGVSSDGDLSSGLSHITLDTVSAPWGHELSKRYIALILGSSWDSKDWPEEGYAGLLGLIGEETVVLLGDKTKVEMAARLEKVPTKAKIVNTAGKTTLAELVALVRGARACIGPDSGPGHIAGAVGVPHITLFGPTPMLRNAPRGSEHLAISAAVACSPCKRRVCPGLGKVCMRLITPKAVLERLAMVP